MTSDFIQNCALLEGSLKEGATKPQDEGRKALLDCVLELAEAAESLNLRNSTIVLDLVADVIFEEVENRAIPRETLAGFVKLGKSAESAIFMTKALASITAKSEPAPLDQPVEDLQKTA